jgi:hypothetical protein
MSKPEYESYKLVELLLALQEDSKLLAAFDKDPDRVMIESGITSEKYRNILKTVVCYLKKWHRVLDVLLRNSG